MTVKPDDRNQGNQDLCESSKFGDGDEGVSQHWEWQSVSLGGTEDSERTSTKKSSLPVALVLWSMFHGTFWAKAIPFFLSSISKYSKQQERERERERE